ncbi:MAG: ArnT family glycosyltransferase [Planctomycetaceae bacterium]
MPRIESPSPRTQFDDSRISRNEAILVAAVILIGIALRCALPGRMSVEHYDEGVYASNLAAGKTSPSARYPFQHLYAPPLLPTLIEYSMTLFGQTSLAAMLVSLVAGGLTPLLLWYSARKWFGPPAGIAAATLAAFSDFHILYSRTALTDALLCFWFLLAVHGMWEAFRRRSLVWATIAGFATGLAWWTKYTGWLPLAVGISGLIPWLLFHRSARQHAGRCIILWIATAVTAVVAWSPWYNALKQYGGYAAVADNHSRYLVGIDKWWPTLLHQVANHRHYSGWLSCLSLLLAVLATGIACRLTGFDSTWNRGNDTGTTSRSGHFAGIAALGIALSAIGILVGPSVLLAFAAVVGMALQILPRLRRQRPSAHDDAALAAWLVAAWFFGTFVSTPSYHPYPRLTLPWLVAAWLGTATGISALIDKLGAPGQAATSTSETPGKRLSLVAIGAALVGLAAALAFNGEATWARGIPGWEDRTDLERATGEVVDAARRFVRDELKRDAEGLVIYVYGEPAVFFHAGKQDGILGVAVAELTFADPRSQRPPLPAFLLAAPPASRSENFAAQWKVFGDRFREVATATYTPSQLVLTDEHHPDALDNAANRPQEVLRLYQLK